MHKGNRLTAEVRGEGRENLLTTKDTKVHKGNRLTAEVRGEGRENLLTTKDTKVHKGNHGPRRYGWRKRKFPDFLLPAGYG